MTIGRQMTIFDAIAEATEEQVGDETEPDVPGIDRVELLPPAKIAPAAGKQTAVNPPSDSADVGVDESQSRTDGKNHKVGPDGHAQSGGSSGSIDLVGAANDQEFPTLSQVDDVHTSIERPVSISRGRPGGETVSRRAAAARALDEADPLIFGTGCETQMRRLHRFAVTYIAELLTRDGKWVPVVCDPHVGDWAVVDNAYGLHLLEMLITHVNTAAIDTARQELGTEAAAQLERQVAKDKCAKAKVVRDRWELFSYLELSVKSLDHQAVDPLHSHPVLKANNGYVSLVTGRMMTADDLRPLHYMRTAQAPTRYVPEAAEASTPGAVAMKTFLCHISGGDEQTLLRRLAFHLCGSHKAVDIIVGAVDAGKTSLADIVQGTLGPALVSIVSPHSRRGTVTAKRLVEALENTRLAFVPDIKALRKWPAAELNDMVGTKRTMGNLMVMSTGWPRGLNSLAEDVRARLGWALHVPTTMPADIERALLFDTDAREYLLASLVREAPEALAQFRECRQPGDVAATDRTRLDAEAVRYYGAEPEDRAIWERFEFTGDEADMVTPAEVAAELQALGCVTTTHASASRRLRSVYPSATSDRHPGSSNGSSRTIHGVRRRKASPSRADDKTTAVRT